MPAPEPTLNTRTPTASQLSPPPRYLTRMLELLAGPGWRVEIEPGGAPDAGPRRPRVSYGIVARNGGASPPRVVVMHGHFDVPEVRLEDVWNVLARLNESQGDVAILCLPRGTPVSPIARDAARRVGVELRPLLA